ncbi:hypothetical protein [Cellulomonas sp. RIT-PI-Y]|jgi:hypothetical protein|uniref:hypothetical protein n=1 Tax=Cellulomonas sp. RIT-PI-Y TaxID=3035297 RepID=UPI0021DA8D06|nr:hypothetical protein [Cellulomonas sp. RIT-PI-Y]
MSGRPSAKALITTGLCLLGGSLVLQLVYLLVQGVALGSYYGGNTFGWSALSLFSTIITMAGFTGGAILAGGLVVKSLSPAAAPSQPYPGYQAPSGYPATQPTAAQPAQQQPGQHPGYGRPTGGYPTGGYPGYPGQQQPPQP